MAKKKEDKKTKIRKAMFANMESDNTIYPKNKSGKRTKPKTKKKR